jgi:hypothetical protein
VGGEVNLRVAWGRAAGVVLLALALAGCLGQPSTREQWDQRWPALEREGRHWKRGAEFTLVTREGRPEGVRETREQWQLLRRDSLDGTFEVRRTGAAAVVTTPPVHPGVPVVPIGTGGHTRGVYPVSGSFVSVSVPAGRFRCGHTWRTTEMHDGAVMRVDEWWAPGVPVPVQRWTRWEGVADTLYSPPARAADVRVGTEWTVLERVRRP